MSLDLTACYNCAKPIPEDNLNRQDSCASCGRDTRVCKNCRHFDLGSNNQCREEQAPRQVDKEKATFCEWFQRRIGQVTNSHPGKDSLLSAADALFKKK